MNWTEKDGIHTLERGGVIGDIKPIIGANNKVVKFNAGLAFPISESLFLRTERFESKSIETAKSAVEEILSLLQPKAKELVWGGDGKARGCGGRYWLKGYGEEVTVYWMSDRWHRPEILLENKTTEECKEAGQTHFNSLVEGLME